MNKLKWQLEMLAWVFTAVLAAGLLYPIRELLSDYRFLTTHLIFIVAFVTLTRYFFLLRFSFLAGKQKLKVVLFFLSIPLVFYFVSEINGFQTTLDEEGSAGLIGRTLPYEEEGVLLYIRNQFLFFAVATVITTVLFALRLVRSVWRFHNRGVD